MPLLSLLGSIVGPIAMDPQYCMPCEAEPAGSMIKSAFSISLRIQEDTGIHFKKSYGNREILEGRITR
jgi:hypothetical protein